MKNMSKRIIVKALIIFGLLGVGHVSGKLIDFNLFSTDSYRLNARFESVAGLEIGYPVKMLGLTIGRVTALRMDQENQAAFAELRIERKITVYEDAFASIKMQGLIGGNYVSVDPGGSGDKLQPGETILETEPLIDIGELIGRYTFGRKEMGVDAVRLARSRDGQIESWVD